MNPKSGEAVIKALETLQNNAGIAVEDIESAELLVDDISELVLKHIVKHEDRKEFYKRINALQNCLISAGNMLKPDEAPKEEPS
jgi:hypothetical protein